MYASSISASQGNGMLSRAVMLVVGTLAHVLVCKKLMTKSLHF